MLCLPRLTIWAKYRSQGIYKVNKTQSSFSAEMRYLNNCLSRLFPNPGLFHRRVKSKHSTNSKQFRDVLMPLNSSVYTELQQWLQNIATVNSSAINLPAPKLYITSDTSKAGCGACYQNLTANGCWSPLETKDHINVLKLKAAFLATKAFLKDCSHISGCFHMDNITAVAYVNNKGGTCSLIQSP